VLGHLSVPELLMAVELPTMLQMLILLGAHATLLGTPCLHSRS
jgi:hypothetical protein